MRATQRQLPAVLAAIAALTWPAPGAEPAAPTLPGWHLVWADEFDQDGPPDPAKWTREVGGAEKFGNNELEFYTDRRSENARVEKGCLIIEARRETWQGRDYTSARLVTRGQGDWLYGRFEIRARLPAGRGTWPAIWMLPSTMELGDGGWPDNGEIDLMEHVGHEAGVIHASTHTRLHNWPNGMQRTAMVQVPDATTAFHTYAMEWERGEIRIYVDERLYFTSRQNGGDWTSWPFYRPFHLVLNVAVGGWGAEKGVNAAAFPQRMEVEFVRVWQRDAAGR